MELVAADIGGSHARFAVAKVEGGRVIGLGEPAVSTERVVSGSNTYESLAAIEGRAVQSSDDTAIWTAALSGTDGLAVAALDRFCLALGSVAGNIALAHGAHAVVMSGGLALRIADLVASSGFGSRFTAKGGFEGMLSAIPVRTITHPQPRLLGAAAAFAEQHAP
jgi:glucokinase